LTASLPLVIDEITIKIEPAQSSLKRINQAVSILIELLKMLLKQYGNMWVRNPSFAALAI